MDEIWHLCDGERDETVTDCTLEMLLAKRSCDIRKHVWENSVTGIRWMLLLSQVGGLFWVFIVVRGSLFQHSRIFSWVRGEWAQ